MNVNLILSIILIKLIKINLYLNFMLYNYYILIYIIMIILNQYQNILNL